MYYYFSSQSFADMFTVFEDGAALGKNKATFSIWF